MKKHFRHGLLVLLTFLLILPLASCSLLSSLLNPGSSTADTANGSPASTDHTAPGTTIPYYTITYDLGYGDPIRVSYTADDPDYIPAKPVREGYNFLYYTLEGKDADERYSGTVLHGSSGDIVFHAVWELVSYSITCDYAGGTGENPSSYTVESANITLDTPTHDGYTFLGWLAEDGTLLETAVIPAGSTGDRSFRAMWSATDFAFGKTSDPEGVPITASISTEMLTVGSTIRLTAPLYYGDYRFVGWKSGNETVSETAIYTFRMPAADAILTAVYEPVEVLTYDRAAGGELTLTTPGFEPSHLLGETAEKDVDYTVNSTGITLKSSFLSTLSAGDHRFWAVLLSGEYKVIGSQLFTVRIAGTTASESSGPADLPESAQEYASRTFTYAGKEHSCVVTTEEELRIAAEYLLLVDGVLQMERDNDPAKEYTFSVWAYGDLLDALWQDDARAELVSRIFSGFSMPMSPSTGIGLSGTSTGAVVTIRVTYRNGLNGIVSTQEKKTGTDLQGLLSASGRGEGFDSFAIDALTETATVRTLYELEALPFGVRPEFSESAGTARQVYETARGILREIIDGGMDNYAKVTAIYAWLGLNVTYDDVAYNAETPAIYSAFTLKGALLDRVAVCDGYASAFRLLCQIEGIRADEVTGLNEFGKTETGHAWNKVWLGGAVLGVDSTWARQTTASGKLYITLQYLFLDEPELINNRHYENAWHGKVSASVAADASVDLFLAADTDTGRGYVVSTSSELATLVRYLRDHGISLAEIRLDSVGNIDLLYNEARFKSGINFLFSHSADAPYATILLE